MGIANISDVDASTDENPRIVEASLLYAIEFELFNTYCLVRFARDDVCR